MKRHFWPTFAALVMLMSLAGGTMAAAAQSVTGNSITSELSGITIDLGASGDAVFLDDAFTVTKSDIFTLETITAQYGTTIVIIDVMDGNVNVDNYMLKSEEYIAATYDYMDWLGGAWSTEHSWDIYSGTYKLNYREHVYLDLSSDPASGHYYGIGIYGSAEQLPADITWLQTNITIDGQSILGSADSNFVESVINGSGGFVVEPVPMQESTVADWSDAGLISATEWQSPYTSTTFNWDGTAIVFPFAQPDAIDASDGVTTIELRTSDRRGEVKLSTAEVDYLPADWVANYTSAEYLESQQVIGQPVTILDSAVSAETGSVISLYRTNLGDVVVVIMDVYVNEEGVTIVTEISASPNDIADVYEIFWDSVQSNGNFYPLTWTVEDIDDLEFD